MGGIRAKALCLQFEGQPILDNLSFTLAPGQIYAICGPSGCGKSTLLRLICGLLLPDSGQLELDYNSISVVFQEDRLLPQLSALENVALVVNGDQKRAMQALCAVELEDEVHKLPQELSGGMRRRVAIARAMAYDGELLLCDEPSNGLDEQLAQRVMQRLLTQWQGRSVLWITHDTDLAEQFSQHILQVNAAPISQFLERNQAIEAR